MFVLAVGLVAQPKSPVCEAVHNRRVNSVIAFQSEDLIHRLAGIPLQPLKFPPSDSIVSPLAFARENIPVEAAQSAKQNELLLSA